MKKRLLTLALLTAAMVSTEARQNAGSVPAQARQTIDLLDNWLFSNDGRSWQQVSVPHDWAISGPFDKKWDLQVVAIEQNGEKEPTEKSGRSGALPWIGQGHYKRTFAIPDGFSGHAELMFDGAMAEPTVFVNGQKAGYWAYGYNAFRVDITPFIQSGENQLAVDLQNVEESSRWYPGAGIYRPVTLLLTPTPTYIDDWSVYVRTVRIDKGKAVVEAEARVMNAGKDMVAQMVLIAPDGQTIASAHDMHIAADGKVYAKFTVSNPQLWSPETPALYRLRTKVCKTGQEQPLDMKEVKTGLRTVRVGREGGFQLNGVTRKLKGVCLHHDLGPLGAAVNKAAIIRQVKTMKEMGCDAIRTSHNMPSQMQMDVCDSLGMMVMAESFDMWVYPKCKKGYARFFREWSQRDITNLVTANRNHPSIVMWSIGNEIPEQSSEEGRQISLQLQGLCHTLDPTRPVTQGLDHAEGAINSGVAKVMDVPGFNYRVHKYQKNIEQLPQGFLLGSETASTVSSRGVYKFPVKPDDNSRFASWAKGYDPTAIKTADGQCSSYDVEYCAWSNLPDDDWRWQDDMPWVIGEFVWTGYDYLGEPTPYDEYWPSRSSYFGICDLAGLPKDRYFLYRSRWNTGEHTVHLLPHWTWPGREGEVTPVYCYTDYDEGELFVNGKSQGRVKKNAAERLDRYRLRWNDVKYEPGELKVVVYDKEGQPVATQTVRTASKPARLQLDVWTQQSDHSPITTHLSPLPSLLSPLSADGEDLAFVTVSLVDKKGNLVPAAADQLRFDVSGAATFKAVCNGDATSLEPFTEPTMKLFSGQLVVIVQASRQPGNATLTVTDPERGLKQKVVIPVQ